jgi:TPR repeat protein
MRWLSLLLISFGMAASGGAFALPQPDAEAAYARGDYATAYSLWLPLAEQGSPRAQLNIARLYERGEGVAQNKAAAAEWYRKAAAQGVTALAAEPGTPMPVDYQGGPYPGRTSATGYPVVTPYPVAPRLLPLFGGWSMGHSHGHSRH